MKNSFFLGLLLLTAFILISGTPLFAFQGVSGGEDWRDLANQIIGPYFASVTAFSGAITALSALIFNYVLKDIGKNWKRLIVFVIALTAAILANVFNFGVFASMTVSGVILTTIQVVFGASGIWAWIKDLVKKKEE